MTQGHNMTSLSLSSLNQGCEGRVVAHTHPRPSHYLVDCIGWLDICLDLTSACGYNTLYYYHGSVVIGHEAALWEGSNVHGFVMYLKFAPYCSHSCDVFMAKRNAYPRGISS